MNQGIPSQYTIRQELGQGNFGSVYLAHRQGSEIQRVALKIIHPETETAEQEWDRWFEAQAPLVSGLDHPNIIRILETGRSGEKTFFIAMIYVTGGTLDQKLKRAALPYAEAVKLIQQVGEALTYAHQHHILHLGLCPHNILLDSQGTTIRPVLTDFGLGSLWPHAPLASSRLAALAAQRYMAPEQLQQESPGIAADVYALAVTFFEMLAGSLPDSRQPGEPLPSLSAVVLEAGQVIDDILRKATARDPAQRFQSVADFVNLLETPQKWFIAQAVEEAQNYLEENDDFNPEKALKMLQLAFNLDPSHPGALRVRGQVRLKQDRYAQALADYRRAYEQQRSPVSEEGVAYLFALNHVAEIYWRQELPVKASKYDEEIMQVLAGKEYKDTPIQPVQEKAWTRLVDYHHGRGLSAYAAGNPRAVNEAVKVLNREIKVLETLKAEPESHDLQSKLEFLREKQENGVGIKPITTRPASIRFLGLLALALLVLLCPLFLWISNRTSVSDKAMTTVGPSAGRTTTFMASTPVPTSHPSATPILSPVELPPGVGLVPSLTPTPAPTLISDLVTTPTPTRISNPISTPTPTLTPILGRITGQINMREGPGREYGLMGRVGPGDEVIVLGRTADSAGLKIKAPNGQEGWITALNYIELPLKIEEIPVAELPPVPSIITSPLGSASPLTLRRSSVSGDIAPGNYQQYYFTETQVETVVVLMFQPNVNRNNLGDVSFELYGINLGEAEVVGRGSYPAADLDGDTNRGELIWRGGPLIPGAPYYLRIINNSTEPIRYCLATQDYLHWSCP